MSWCVDTAVPVVGESSDEVWGGEESVVCPSGMYEDDEDEKLLSMKAGLQRSIDTVSVRLASCTFRNLSVRPSTR